MPQVPSGDDGNFSSPPSPPAVPTPNQDKVNMNSRKSFLQDKQLFPPLPPPPPPFSGCAGSGDFDHFASGKESIVREKGRRRSSRDYPFFFPPPPSLSFVVRTRKVGHFSPAATGGRFDVGWSCRLPMKPSPFPQGGSRRERLLSFPADRWARQSHKIPFSSPFFSFPLILRSGGKVAHFRLHVPKCGGSFLPFSFFPNAVLFEGVEATSTDWKILRFPPPLSFR